MEYTKKSYQQVKIPMKKNAYYYLWHFDELVDKFIEKHIYKFLFIFFLYFFGRIILGV